MMKRARWGLLALLVVLLVAVPASVTFAQDGGDKVIVGQNYTLAGGQVLNGSLTVIGGTAVLKSESAVDGDVLVMGGTLTASGVIEGDVKVWGGNVSLTDTAVVNGDLATFGGSLHDHRPGGLVAAPRGYAHLALRRAGDL